ncbi:MAG: Tad domain-containing protein [Hyphomicrobiaceae bacterium]|nr:Tad domain-containing protein [Hyphomicrobiaceae bacterium]
MRTSRLPHKLASNNSGGVVLLFSLLMPVIALFGSIAIDYSRSVALQRMAQAAIDAAVLAGSDALLADDLRQEKFASVLNANFSHPDAGSLRSSFEYTRASGGTGQLAFTYTSGLLHVAGFETVAIEVKSQARQDLFDLEIALVLDVSGSMRASMGSTTRLDALKSAATKLVNELDAARLPSQSIRFSIVPFTMNVNVGTTHTSFVDDTTNALFTGTSWAGCVLERPAPYTNQDVYKSGDAKNGGNWQAYIWPPEPNSDNSCINPSNGTNAGYRSVEQVGPRGTFDPWTKGPNYNCVRHAITPLTSSVSDTLTAINALSSHPNMGTILAPGIAWGHRLLSPEQPFTEGASFGPGVRKIMIVITDGEQTTEGEYQSNMCSSATNTTANYRFTPSNLRLDGRAITSTGPRDMFSPYGYVLDSAPFGSNSNWNEVRQHLATVTLDACSEFKGRANGSNSVSLYTIAASTGAGPGTQVYNLLQQCASSDRNFFYAADATKLKDAFYAIARESTQLRLTN